MTVEPDRISAHTQITNHVAGGLALLTSQFRDKDVLAGVFTPWLTQVQYLEDAAWAVLALTLDNATDDQLDQIGALVGQGRGELLDTPYRALLRAVILAHRSAGTGDELHAIIALLLGALATYTLSEPAPAAIVVEPDMAPAAGIPADVAVGVLRLAKAGGVRLVLASPPADFTFTFSSLGEAVETDADRGFSVDGTAPGGLFMWAVE